MVAWRMLVYDKRRSALAIGGMLIAIACLRLCTEAERAPDADATGVDDTST